MVGPAEFYDDLAGEYDRLFEDWWAAALWHGSVVAEVLGHTGVRPPAAVLDCTCGIGTQALPLVQRGYWVTATDISAGAVERARREAAQRGLQLTLSVSDVRAVRDAVEGSFDAVISCDNALPHLLTDDDLDKALRSVRACLGEGGLFLASIRDYDALIEERPQGTPVSLHGGPGHRHGSGQAWRWQAAGGRVEITLFTFVESATGWSLTTHETTYRALRRDELTAALGRSGFDEVRWLMPQDSGYYQPIVTAQAKATATATASY